MKLTIEQIKEIAGFLEGSNTSPIIELVQQVTGNQNATDKNIDEEDYNYLYQLVEECPNCGIWVTIGTLYTDERTDDLYCEFCCDF